MAEHLQKADFYEEFWADSNRQLMYAFDSAVRDRFPAIQRVWGTMKPPRRVLDFGCGNGVLSYWMFANGFAEEVVAADISRTGIEFARQRFGQPGLDYVKLQDEERLASLGTFDAVVSSHVLEHLDNPLDVLRSLRKLADWYVFEVPLERCLLQDVVWRLRRNHPRTDNPVGHVQFWNRSAFRSLLAEVGLFVVREYHYASAPFSPYTGPAKRLAERVLLSSLGTTGYSRLMATHYAVLARAI